MLDTVAVTRFDRFPASVRFCGYLCVGCDFTAVRRSSGDLVTLSELHYGWTHRAGNWSSLSREGWLILMFQIWRLFVVWLCNVYIIILPCLLLIAGLGE